jgi:hypothetical protein
MSTPWLDALPSRSRNVIRNAHDAGDLPNLSRGTVRAMGKAYWLRQPGLGAVSVKAIGEAVGGFASASNPALLPRDFAPWHALRVVGDKSAIFDMRTGDKLEDYAFANGTTLRNLAGHMAQERGRSVVVYDASCHAWYRVTPGITSPPLPGLWGAVLRQEQAKQDKEFADYFARACEKLTGDADELVERFAANPSFDPILVKRAEALAAQVHTLVDDARNLLEPKPEKSMLISKGTADEKRRV